MSITTTVRYRYPTNIVGKRENRENHRTYVLFSLSDRNLLSCFANLTGVDVKGRPKHTWSIRRAQHAPHTVKRWNSLRNEYTRLGNNEIEYVSSSTDTHPSPYPGFLLRENELATSKTRFRTVKQDYTERRGLVTARSSRPTSRILATKAKIERQGSFNDDKYAISSELRCTRSTGALSWRLSRCRHGQQDLGYSHGTPTRGLAEPAAAKSLALPRPWPLPPSHG